MDEAFRKDGRVLNMPFSVKMPTFRSNKSHLSSGWRSMRELSNGNVAWPVSVEVALHACSRMAMKEQTKWFWPSPSWGRHRCLGERRQQANSEDVPGHCQRHSMTTPRPARAWRLESSCNPRSTPSSRYGQSTQD